MRITHSQFFLQCISFLFTPLSSQYSKALARIHHQLPTYIWIVVCTRDPHTMSVSLSSLEYLWMEAVPLCRGVTNDLGLQENMDAEVEYRMEKHGFNVGRGLAYVVTRNEDRYLTNQIDIIKFLCKEFWMLLFGNHADTLKTNHKDTYVVIDNKFSMCMRMSTNGGPQDMASQAAPYLWFPAGIIRGFLHGMGIESRVDFSASEIPSVEFSIITK